MYHMREFKEIYTNGCSLMAGSGLDGEHLHHFYKNKHNIIYNDARQVTFPTLISKHFNVPLTDESMSGSGPERLIRKTYDFIRNREYQNLQDVLFILEFNLPTFRLDIYSKSLGDYLIVNVDYHKNGEIKSVSAVESYTEFGQSVHPDEIRHCGDEILTHLKNYFDPLSYTDRIKNESISLLNFMETMGLNYTYINEAGTISVPRINNKILDKILDRQFFFEGTIPSISQFTEKYRLGICHETNNKFGNDSHPGVLGHLKMSEEFIKQLTPKVKLL